MDDYRYHLINAVKELKEFKSDIFMQIVNLGMSGELENINETFEEGDEFNFDMEMFDDLKDVNVQKLIALHDKLDEEIERIITINAITESELSS